MTKVSVAMITYNHAGYIAQALDSVVSQEVNFQYEVLVGEDCSTDGTRRIVQEYQSKYPERIKLITSPENVGMLENFVRVLKAADGQYVALLEGDDYWTSPDKLQKQVDFLDAHPECALCFHNATVFFQDGSQAPAEMCPVDQKELTTVEDLLKVNFIPTCSVVYRNGLLVDFPDWYHRLRMGDWTLFILIAQYGKIGYLREMMGAYRRHTSGAWSGRSRVSQLEETLAAYSCLKDYFGEKYATLIDQKALEYRYLLAVERRRLGDEAEARRSLGAVEPHFLTDPVLWQGRVLETARQLEESDGAHAATEFLAWITTAMQTERGPSQWVGRLYGEWHARHAFSAHSSGDRSVVRQEVLLAIKNDWRLLGNRGLLSILLTSMI